MEQGGPDVIFRDTSKGLNNSTVQELLSCPLSLSANSLGKGQKKVKEAKLIQTVKVLLGSQSLDFLIPK